MKSSDILRYLISSLGSSFIFDGFLFGGLADRIYLLYHSFACFSIPFAVFSDTPSAFGGSPSGGAKTVGKDFQIKEIARCHFLAFVIK